MMLMRQMCCPPLSLVDKVWLVKYDVSPEPHGRAWSTSIHHVVFKVRAVRELVKDWVLRPTEVVLQLGVGSGSC